MNPEQRSVLGLTSASHALIHVCELSVPPLLVLLQQEFSATDFELGQIVGVYGLLYGLGALPAGVLVDRIGSKRLLVACLWGASCSLLGMAWSPTLGWFTACAACMGLSLSVYHPAGTSLITHHLPAEARVFAIHGMAGSFGVSGASAIAGALGALWGWRWALTLVAVPGLLLGTRVLALRSHPAKATRAHGARIRWRRLALLLGAAGFMGMVYRGMTTFLPKLFAISYTQDVSSGVALGGALTTGALLVGMAGMYAAGRLSDSGRHPALVFFLGAVAQGPLLVAMAHFSGPLLVPLAMGVAFFTSVPARGSAHAPACTRAGIRCVLLSGFRRWLRWRQLERVGQRHVRARLHLPRPGRAARPLRARSARAAATNGSALTVCRIL
jgi:MFS family permease